MLKRLFDIIASMLGLILGSPILVPVMILVWLQDYHSPFYIAPRVGRDGRIFKMVKMRSMVINADRSKVDSTSANDPRITPLGQFIRSYKLDELTQLWNVLKGDMSLVGPRPNVQRETDMYTQVERGLLSVRPGITDIASIVFADEGDILKDSQDPDLDYNQLIRPWKSRLGLLYVENSSFPLDVRLIFLTGMAIISRKRALDGVQKVLADLNADETLKRVTRREDPLEPFPPPGASDVVTDRSHIPSLYQTRAHNRYFLMADLILLPLAVVISFLLRFDEMEMVTYANTILLYAGLAMLIKPPIFYLSGLYRRYWRYAGVHDLLTIAGVMFLASAVVMVIVTSLISWFIPIGVVPRSVPFLDWLVSTALVGGVRLTARLTWERPIGEIVRQRFGGDQIIPARKRVLIVGAGDAGAITAREMQSNSQLGLEPIGFVDDNPAKIGKLVRNLPVLGTSIDIPRLVTIHQADEVLIAIPTASGKAIRRIVNSCQEAGVESKTIPGMYELISGQVSVNYLRDIQIDDLLRREPIEVDEPGISSYLEDKCVLITGAGGSIGSELTRQVARYNPSKLILLGHGENSIYTIAREMQNTFLDLDIHACIADIRNVEQIEHIFRTYRPQVLFHAAAHKHVPLMESNVGEAVLNNIIGTQTLLEAACQAQVERFVLISSDKAVNPVSIMGTTKRIAEFLVQEIAQQYQLNFVAVRFGNVLGSRGSVVPLFKQQIAQGGPITITHPDVERFFMTIPEAVHLVIQAGALGQGGEVFVLDMGRPVKVIDLAKDLIKLSGLKSGEDIDIVFTGLRPGEKLSEELFATGESTASTKHPKIQAIKSSTLEKPLISLSQAVSELKEAILKQDDAQIHQILSKLVPNARLQQEETLVGESLNRV